MSSASRKFKDRAFAWVGCAATFFGLGMLLIFFIQLIVDLAGWLHESPRLIDYQNYRYHEKLSQKETALKTKQDRTDEEIVQSLRTEDPKQLAFFQKHLRGKWEQILVRAEDAAGPAAKAALAAKWQAIKDDALQRNEVIAEKAELVQKYLKKTFPDYPKSPDAKSPEEEHPLDAIVYLSLDDMLVELQSVIEVRTEAELGIRHDKSSGELLEHFLTSNPSNFPQDAGIWPALLGSLWLAIITILFAVPVGVGAALYLEEYKQSGWLGRLIQVNINNLAGVPSVVYGILGGFVFVELIFKPMHQEQEALVNALAADADLACNAWDHFLLWLPTIAARNVLGGGLTLGLLTMPVVIVSAQEAIRAVPPSIRHGAYALGATRWQTIWRLVLPQARPGILTGTILSISRAIGEAAPLILFGALLFVGQSPSLFSGFTVMPMQIFGWADRPGVAVPLENPAELQARHAATTIGLMASPGAPAPLLAASSGTVTSRIPTRTVEMWQYNAAVASLVLLGLLLVLNSVAIYLRYRAQRRLSA